MSELPDFTIRQLLDAGVHFGHKTMRWNPKMASYLYGSRSGIHIIDLQQTVPMLHKALEVVREVAKANGRILFVGTKRQASDIVAEAAKRCGQYYVNHRWLGGMMTNWSTISVSIKTLRTMEEQVADATSGAHSRLTKKELLELTRQCEKLERSLGGIKDMGGKPDLLVIIDTNKEELAVKEAAKLNIPTVAILDSNSDPDGITYPVPGNDDATRAIKLYCKLISDAALCGLEESMSAAGVDVGASEKLMEEAFQESGEEGQPQPEEGKEDANGASAKKSATKKATAAKTTKPAAAKPTIVKSTTAKVATAKAAPVTTKKAAS